MHVYFHGQKLVAESESVVESAQVEREVVRVAPIVPKLSMADQITKRRID